MYDCGTKEIKMASSFSQLIGQAIGKFWQMIIKRYMYKGSGY